MIIPRVYAENFWANLDKYVDEKYIIDDGKQHFVRNRKITQESIMKYPLYNHGRTTGLRILLMESIMIQKDLIHLRAVQYLHVTLVSVMLPTLDIQKNN